MADSLFNFPQLQAGSMQMPYLQGVNPYDQMVSGGFSGGPMAGTMFNDFQNTLASNQRASDLEYQNAQNTYQNTMADNPLRQTQRDITAKAQGVEQAQYASGARLQQASTASQADIQKNIAIKSSADLQIMNNHLDGMSQIGGEVLANKDFLKDPEAQARVATQAKQYGITGLPNVGEWKQADINHVQKMNDVAVQTREFRQKQQILNQGYAQDVGAANAAQGVGRIPLTTYGQYQTQMAVASMQANLALLRDPIAKQTQIGVINKLHSGATLTEDDVDKLESAYLTEIKGQPTFAADVSRAITSLNSLNRSQLESLAKEAGLDPSKYATPTALKNALSPRMENIVAKREVDQQVGPLLKSVPFNGDDGKQKFWKQDPNGNWVKGYTGNPNPQVQEGNGLGMFNTRAGVPGQNAGPSPMNFGPNGGPPGTTPPPQRQGVQINMKGDPTKKAMLMPDGSIHPIGGSPQPAPQTQPAPAPQGQQDMGPNSAFVQQSMARGRQPQPQGQPAPQSQSTPYTTNSTASTSITDMEAKANQDPSIKALKAEIDKETQKGGQADIEHQKVLISAINAIRKNKYGLS